MSKQTPQKTTRSSRTAKAVAEKAEKAGDLVVMKVSRAKDGGVEIQASDYDITSGDRSFRSRSIKFEGADRSFDTSTRRKMVGVSRDMDRNSLLSAMLDRWIDGTVGSQLNFRPATGDDGWNKYAYQLIREKMKRCDHRGFFDAVGLTRTMLRALGTDGEQLLAMTGDGLVQVIEAHQIGTPRDKISGTSRINDGIRLDDTGRPLGYWVSDEVYGGYFAKSTNGTYISASDSIMPAYRKRASQTHGIPVVGAGLKLHDRVDGYIDNEALAAEIDACLTYFIRKKPTTTPTPPAAFGRTIETQSDGTAKILRKVEPGIIARVAADEEVEQFGAKRPGSQFTPFVEMGLTMVGATIGVPLTLALLDFKKLNYSNTRSLLLQMWQTWQIWHRCTVVPCWQWIYQRWVLKEIASSPSLRTRDDAFAAKWLPRRWPWVDPLKEVQAMREEIAMGIGTITDQLELLGYTLEEYLEERQREIEAFARAGVPTTTITGEPSRPTVPAAGGVNGRDDDDEEDDGENPDNEDEEVPQ